MDIPAEDSGKKSQIQEFFDGLNIFITGGTGFLGQVLIEKLMRSCPRIKKIYLLIRLKNGRDAGKRVEDLLSGPLFAKMREDRPDYRSHVVIIPGNLELPECGISAEDQQLLVREVNVVFHVGAIIRLQPDLRSAINANIRATRDLLILSRQMANLKAFVHVSTAFSNCLNDNIREDFYEAPLSANAALSLSDYFDDDLLQKLTPHFQGHWPNLYIYTKCIAEDVVKKLGKNMPVAVFRPAVVTGTAQEPIRGWINDANGPNGVIAAGALGLIRVIIADGSCNSEIIPADYVINAIIACAWNIGTTHVPIEEMEFENGLKQHPGFMNLTDHNLCLQRALCNLTLPKTDTPGQKSSIPVYNFVSSSQNKITIEQFINQCGIAFSDFPPQLAVRPYSLSLCKYKLVFLGCHIFLHLIPAAIGDGCLIICRKSPRLLASCSKLQKRMSAIAYFCTNQWNFDTENVKELWEKLSDRDKEIFYFDIRKLDWEEYLYHYAKGIRQYLLRDSMDTVSVGRKKNMRYLMVRRATVGALFFICFSALLFKALGL